MPGEDDFIKLSRTGIFLGFDEEAAYEQRLQVINPGDFIVFYTDGVTDAINASKHLFGQERFESLLAAYRRASAAEILAAITDALDEFTGGTAPYDDITLVVAKRL